MGINWIAGRIHWKPHEGRDGRVYSLAHVHPFSFDIRFEAHRGQPARTVTVHVDFTIHVFTCSIADAGPNPEFYSDDRETRAFDLERYGWSNRLKTIVSGLEKRKCYFTDRSNYFTFDLEGVPPGHEYRVYFDVRRRNSSAVELIVQSAYAVRAQEIPGTRSRKRAQFRVIVSEALRGRKPKAPP